MMVTRGRALTIFAALLLSLVAITPATAVPRFDAEDDALNGRHQSDTESSDAPASTPASDDSPEKPGAGSGSDAEEPDRKSTRLNSSHVKISYAVSCLKKKKISK